MRRTLTVDTSEIADTDGMETAVFRYQWFATIGLVTLEFHGETSSTYTLAPLSEGLAIKVKVSFTDDRGHSETLTSAATETVIAAAPNSEPTGLPTISGTPQVGETLTADTSPIADQDGLTNVAYRYQWIAGGADIDGATGSSYLLTSSERGQTVQVRVTFTDDAGNAESLTSAATVGVAPRPNSEPTGLPAINGTPQVGKTLTADTSGISDADGLTNVSYRYQWMAGGSDIDGATGSTYLLTSSDVGKTIQVRVTFTDDAGNEETLTSAATETVAAAPVPLTASFLAAPSSHDGDNSFTFELRFSEEVEAGYARIRDDALNVTGGDITQAQRKEQSSNQNWTITVEPDGNGQISITLPATTGCDDTGAICTGGGKKLSGRVELTVNGPEEQSQERQNNPATGLPTIDGTPQVDQTLTADTSGIRDADGLTNATYSYQWTAGGSDIDGATGASHSLTSSEQGQTIRVKVTFTDDADNAESLTSVATVAVGAKPNTPATGLPAISGTPQVGETLTADTANIADEDGLTSVSYRYQWTAGGADISGATGASHSLTSSEEGQTIRVRVSFTDDAGNDESLTSVATDPVAALLELTASLPHSGFQSPRHLGEDDRPQVVVAFSLPVASFEKTTPSVSLTGAAVSSVRRHEEDGLENAWIFFLDPDGNDDIVFRLVAGQPCDSGGICTGDGTTLSEGVQVTLPGPKEEEDNQPEPQSPPPAPTNLTATVNADGHIALSWTAPNDDSVTGYRVLRRRPSEGEGALLVYVANTQSTATTFTDTGVTAGVKHVYRVKAINAAGLSGWSNYVNQTP